MDKVLLTAENIKDADEFVDGGGTTWWRNGPFWALSANEHNRDTDDAIVSYLGESWMRGAYVTRWKPGREPKEPGATKWVKGYVTRGNDFAPDGVMLCSSTGNVFESGGVFVGPGLVVVREAPPPPAEEPWVRRVVEARGKGHDAQVRFIGDRQGLSVISAHAIVAHAKPAPERAKVAEMLCEYRIVGGPDKHHAIIDYVCGPEPKDGDA